MHVSARPARVWSFAGMTCLVLCLGCDSGLQAGQHPVHPVEGQVLFNGKPLAGAQVSLHPVDESKFGDSVPRPMGQTDDNGRFKLMTYISGDGAPEGSYLVAVAGQARPQAEAGNLLDAAKSAGKPDPLGNRYINPKTSGLSATIKPGPNNLAPFDLKETGGASQPVGSNGRGR